MTTPGDRMLNAARTGYESLGSDEAQKLCAFLSSQIYDTGGFKGLNKMPDIYYTAFGIDCMLAADMDIAKAGMKTYSATNGSFRFCDIVHLSAYARVLSRIGSRSSSNGERLREKIEKCRSEDGGYANRPGEKYGAVYASFLAMLAIAELAGTIRQPDRLVSFLEGRRGTYGGFINHCGQSAPSTPATAAAIVLLKEICGKRAFASEWFDAVLCDSGGFCFVPGARAPDLISTAVAIHCLREISADITIRSRHIAFVESFWHEDGGFCGGIDFASADCEHTFYALMAIGDILDG